MTRRIIELLVSLALGLPVASLAADAQPPGKVPRLGVLSIGSPPSAAERQRPFLQALRELGWVEGQNITVERRYAEGDSDRLPELAGELVRLQVDVILAAGTVATLPAQQATTTIPIVMVAVADPVGRGLVASLARPGGNITGVAWDPTPEIRGKHLQLLKEAVPQVSRVAILWGPHATFSQAYRTVTDDVGRKLGLTLRGLEVQRGEDFAKAFAAIKDDPIGIDALMAMGPLASRHRGQIADFATQHQLPTMFEFRELVDAGGLMSYGPSLSDLYRRAATYVDKILKGAKPADLPVEQSMRFELVINLKTAKALGLTIPPTLLFQADEVIR